jgi:hypothetical protein
MMIKQPTRAAIVASGMRIPHGIAVAIATFGFAADIAIAASTLLPGAPIVPQWPQFALLPVAGAAGVLGRMLVDMHPQSGPERAQRLTLSLTDGNPRGAPTRTSALLATQRPRSDRK